MGVRLGHLDSVLSKPISFGPCKLPGLRFWGYCDFGFSRYFGLVKFGFSRSFGHVEFSLGLTKFLFWRSIRKHKHEISTRQGA